MFQTLVGAVEITGLDYDGWPRKAIFLRHEVRHVTKHMHQHKHILEKLENEFLRSSVKTSLGCRQHIARQKLRESHRIARNVERAETPFLRSALFLRAI
ncbi:hypothetical protein VTN96DRAFT_6421 [Rasamsonia emersonii]